MSTRDGWREYRLANGSFWKFDDDDDDKDVSVVATCFWCLLYYALVLARFTTVVFRSFKPGCCAHTTCC